MLIMIGVLIVLNEMGVDWIIIFINIVVREGKLIVISSGVVIVVGVLKLEVFLIKELKY